MKILYVGDSDCLAASVLERLVKEDHDVFVLCEKSEAKDKNFRKYRHYIWSERAEDIQRIFASVAPDAVVYAGTGYLDEEWSENRRDNLRRLSVVAEECTKFEKCRLILFSSTEVYGADSFGADETARPHPESAKGIFMLQQENIADVYRDNRNLRVIILRLSDVFGNEITVGGKDWLGKLAGELSGASEFEFAEQPLCPIHALDVADAVVRVLESENNPTYNICSSEQLQKSRLVALMKEELCRETCVINETGQTGNNVFASNARIKKEKEWVEFWSLEKLAQEKKLRYINKNKSAEKEKKGKNRKAIIGGWIRKTIENAAIFGVFFAIYCLTREHSLFSQVDWLLIYVVAVSLAYGIKQSTLAVVLAGSAYFITSGIDIFEMTNFYSYAESVLMIVEFLFFGIIVGYSADTLRENVRNSKEDLSKVMDDYEKLKEINNKNVMLKNEYEKRVLDSKTSLPKLYSIINRITVLDINRIFVEILNVVADLMQTDTVAVYRVSSNSSYLRLIASLNKKSAMEGNSWNLKNFPDIELAIRQTRLYEGDIWKNEPAIVLPVGSSKGCEVAIVIKELPLEAHSLHSINLLRTLLILISESIEKALQYDNIVRGQKYYKDTNILYPEEFRKAVSLAEEKKQRDMAESCIISLQTRDMLETFHTAEKLFREMDIWGSDESGNLYVLLANTSEKDAKIVLERLDQNGIKAKMVEKFD